MELRILASSVSPNFGMNIFFKKKRFLFLKIFFVGGRRGVRHGEVRRRLVRRDKPEVQRNGKGSFAFFYNLVFLTRSGIFGTFPGNYVVKA